MEIIGTPGREATGAVMKSFFLWNKAKKKILRPQDH
jgi:hypothetical protein